MYGDDGMLNLPLQPPPATSSSWLTFAVVAGGAALLFWWYTREGFSRDRKTYYSRGRRYKYVNGVRVTPYRERASRSRGRR